MITIIFIAILIVFLTLSQRKMGYFNLVLLSGVVLNKYWNKEITNFLTTSNLTIPELTLSGIVGIILILAPALLILTKNPKQENWIIRIVSSAFSAFFAFLLLLPYFEKVFVLDDISKNIAIFLGYWMNWVILAGVVLSILSIAPVKFKKNEKKS